MRIVVGLALVVAGAVTWALFWPAPRTPLRCGADDPPNCRAVQGRVLYVPRSDRGVPYSPLHLILLSRDSVALPLITVVKIPAVLRPRHTPRIGRWISAVGQPHRGSNGETDLGVDRYVMGD